VLAGRPGGRRLTIDQVRRGAGQEQRNGEATHERLQSKGAWSLALEDQVGIKRPGAYSSGAPPALATWLALILSTSNLRAAAVMPSMVALNSARAPRLKRSGLIRATTKALR